MGTPAGIEFHTLSIMGLCARTGMLGVAITTSDLCVGSRCPYVRPKVGAVSTQATTDPRLGPMALDLLEKGYAPEDAIKELEASDPHIERRQIGVVGWNGKSSVRTGAQNLPWAGHISNEDYVAMGNGLSSEKVVKAMAEVFKRLKANDLEERLLRALEAGQQAGGEARDMTPHHSAALLVYGNESFSRVDLRVDEHATPIVELRRIFDLYRPKIDYFTLRVSDPEAAIAMRDRDA